MAVPASRALVRKLYQDYAGAVYSIALRITGCHGAAEDVVHDIFLTVQDGRTGDVENLEGWFRGAAIRRSLMHLRSMRRRREVSLEPWFGQREADGAENGRQQQLVEAIALERAVARLSAKLRVVFVLHHIEGLTHQEISEVLHISVAASAKRVSRAVESIRKQLGGP